MVDKMIEKKKKHEGSCLSPTSAIRKLAFDRFVLTHFFLLFLLCFIVGVLFLHSMFTFSESGNGENLNKILNDLGVNQVATVIRVDNMRKEKLTPPQLLTVENITFISTLVR